MLINATAYDWQKTHQHSYQMKSWSFLETIKAGQHAPVYVEWDEGVFNTKADDAGEVVYTLTIDGKTRSFEIQARARGGFGLQAVWRDLVPQGKSTGDVTKLGWRHDGVTPFILSGGSEGFVCNETPADWMQKNLSWLGRRTLREICMPGSHDAGMSKLVDGTAYAVPQTTQNQTLDIYAQLVKGVRYFDIRPIIGGGNFHTGHYSLVPKIDSWQGARGQSIQEVIENLNRFTKDNKELVILSLSHAYNTDVGRDYTDFTQGEWDRLVGELEKINDRFFFKSGEPAGDLTRKCLQDYIGGGKACVLIVADAGTGVDIGRHGAKGIYPASLFPVYDRYAEKQDFDEVIADQLHKMTEERSAPTSIFFIISWTLTFGTLSTIAITASKLLPGLGGPSIAIDAFGWDLRGQAAKLNALLVEKLWPKVTKQTFPNVLYMDEVRDTVPTALALAITRKAAAGVS
ncbi:PI-PLC domain-containing protein [Acidisoma sp. 7E03]